MPNIYHLSRKCNCRHQTENNGSEITFETKFISGQLETSSIMDMFTHLYQSIGIETSKGEVFNLDDKINNKSKTRQYFDTQALMCMPPPATITHSNI